MTGRVDAGENGMQRANIVITLALSIVSVLAWVDFWYWMFVRGYSMARPPGLELQQAIAFSAYACVGWALVTFGHVHRDDETRCRKCRFILKGLSAPRCPECGEPI